MTVPSPSVSEVAPPSDVAELPVVSSPDIDRSCRAPVLVLFGAAAVWLAVGAVLGVISAIKMHAPGFLPGPGWLTFGRVQPVVSNAFVYGFVLQSGLGVALWMFCRLGRNVLQGGRIIPAASLFWNLGLSIGTVWILAGGSTGYEWLEMPRIVSPVLFCAYALVGAWGLITLHLRKQRSLYVSQWFLLASLLWFPWVYSTAQLLLIYFPVRGIMQAIVNSWYVHNLFELCLAPLGLAIVFYFVPKLLKRPLHSHGLALFGFWLLVFVGGWGGLRMGDPAPNWLSGVSVVARVFLLVPILAFGMSWYGTTRSNLRVVRSDLPLRFVLVAAISYLLAAVLETVAAIPAVSKLTAFTLYSQGLTQLKIHGFLSMALAGAIYYIAPRVAGSDWPSTRPIRIHFWCATAGSLLTVIALLLGGVLQGAGINNPQTDFLNVVRTTIPFLGLSTLGVTLLCIGYAAFVVQLWRLLAVFCPCSAIRRWLSAASAPGLIGGTKA